MATEKTTKTKEIIVVEDLSLVRKQLALPEASI